MKVSTCANRPILEPCGLKDIEYQVDPYIGCAHYCYYCYALGEALTDWSEEILIHEDIAGRLADELKDIAPQTVYLGYHTDPYQPCEAEYGQTRKVLELLLEKGFSASILTKSDLIVRDMDILREMPEATASVSVAFNDNEIRRLFEANTKDTEARIEALHQMKAAGVTTNALLCPVLPYITDVPALMDMLAPCTDLIWIYGLSIMDRLNPNWQNLEVILHRHFPELKNRIETVVFDREHPYWTQVRQDLVKMREERNLNLDIHV